MTTEQAAVHYRPLMFSIAKEILGNIKDAEDVVQETLIKWLRNDPLHIENTKAYLVRAVINACLNFKKLVRNNLEIELSSFQEWLPDRTTVELIKSDLEHEMMEAYKALRERLSPSERAVFILKEFFNMEYEEISYVYEKQVTNCRKLFSRAQKAMEDKKSRFVSSYEEQKRGLAKFMEATETGKLEQLIGFLRTEMDKNGVIK